MTRGAYRHSVSIDVKLIYPLISIWNEFRIVISAIPGIYLFKQQYANLQTEGSNRFTRKNLYYVLSNFMLHSPSSSSAAAQADEACLFCRYRRWRFHSAWLPLLSTCSQSNCPLVFAPTLGGGSSRLKWSCSQKRSTCDKGTKWRGWSWINFASLHRRPTATLGGSCPD